MPAQASKPAEKKESQKKWVNIADNLDYVFSEKGIMMIKVDPSKELRSSGSGKTIIIATCGRPKQITLKDGSVIFLNLTAYKYPTAK